MSRFNDMRDLKLARFRATLEKGEADLANGRVIVLKDDEAVREFFARLAQGSPGCDPRR